MADRIIVLVTERDDEKHGEISVLESPDKAARLVETLLEAGFEEQRIRVFTGHEMEMQVTQRPVVALVTGDHSTEEAAAAPEGRSADDEEHAGQEEKQDQSAKNDKRFSSMFRSS